MKPQRDMEDPTTFAQILMRKLGNTHPTAFREAEDTILEAMNEALSQAHDAAVRNPGWGPEAIAALKVKLNNPSR